MSVVRAARRWLVALTLSLALVGVVSQATTDTLDAKRWDPELEASFPWPGAVHRHRTEGWANTRHRPFGAHGVPDLSLVEGPLVGIWGDSHVEGLCLADEDKIASQVNRRMEGQDENARTAFGVGRGGSSVAEAVHLMPRYEARFPGIRHHYILVCRLAYIEAVRRPGQPHEIVLGEQAHLHHAPRAPSRPWMQDLVHRSEELGLGYLARFGHILMKDGLRFTPGTATQSGAPGRAPLTRAEHEHAWGHLFDVLRQTVKAPVTFVYCPHVPRILAGRVTLEDRGRSRYAWFRDLARARGFTVLDATRPLLALYRERGAFPRGFTNKWPSAGHLNAGGMGAVAEVIVRHARSR